MEEIITIATRLYTNIVDVRAYVDGDVLLFQEGTTQGDPLAMPMYALATIPLIRKLKNSVNDVNQVWYADDASGAEKVNRLRESTH